MKVEVTLPKLGESIVGATVVKWFKQEGDFVRLDEPLLEVSTDKVNSEIPSPAAGVLTKILAVQDEEIEVGAPLAWLETKAGAQVATTSVEERATPPAATLGNADFFSPAVLRFAALEGISLEVLRTIKGSGEGGRVTKKDIEHFIRSKKPPCPLASPLASSGALEERVKLTGMRKAIADNMVRSFYEAPHASVVTEVDMTDVMELIAREKESFFAAHSVKLTVTSFLLQALTKAVQKFPMLNASLEGETIVMKRYVNAGIAVNIDGGLVVPVLKECEKRNLISIAKEIADLSARARSGKLSHDEVAGGTITLTNFGMTGALLGIPIIRYNEVAILGAGAIKKRLIVRDDDSLAIRHMLYLTLTFDHRLVDGIYGCDFLSTLKSHLESVTTSHG